MIKTDVKFQVADQCPRGSDVANFSVTTVLCALSCCVSYRLEDLRSSDQ